MTTIERVRLGCNEPDCPHPNDEDFHRPVCWAIKGVEHSRDAQHQHVPKRSQGGRTVAAVLCSYCHDKIDNGPWGNAVEFGVYRIWDHRGNTLLRVGAPTAEGESIRKGPADGPAGESRGPAASHSPSAAGASIGALSSAGDGHPGKALRASRRSPSTAEPSPAEPGASTHRAPDLLDGGGTAPPSPPPSQLDSWCQKGMSLLFACRRMETMAVVIAFEVGDWVNEGEDSFGELAGTFTDVFSYWQIAKWASVARRVPEGSRLLSHDRITLEHHRAVKECEPDEQRRLLVMAAEQGLSSRALREIVTPSEAQETEKRWTLSDLRERLAAWPGEQAVRNNGRKFCEAFLESLEESI